MTTTLRLGTASPSPGPTTADSLSRVETLTRSAADLGIDLLLLPEAYLGGYPRGSSFGCVVGDRTDAGRDEFARYFEGAVDLGDDAGPAGAGRRWIRREMMAHGSGSAPRAGETLGEKKEEEAPARGDGTRERLERAAAETGVFLVVGCVERAGGSLYCSVLYVCPREGVVGKRRKVMPTASERLVWAQGCPSTLRAVSTTIRGVRINMAAAVCWENYMPLLRQALYAQNVNLYLAPTADARDAWLALMRTVGTEGRCFVVSSNMCVRQGASSSTAAASTASRRRQVDSPRRRRKSIVYDEDGNEIVLSCEQQEEEKKEETAPSSAEYSSRGGSCIVSPFGDVLSGPQWEDDEGIIYADVDMRDCIRGRLDLDTAGSYSRGDAFKLTVQGLDLDSLPYY